MLPNDFPPYQTVYYWFRRLMRRFLFRTIHDLALMLDRMCEQREASQLFSWRKLEREGALVAVQSGESVVPASELAAARAQIAQL